MLYSSTKSGNSDAVNMIHAIIYLSILGLGVLLLSIYYFSLRKSNDKLPESWRTRLQSKNFRISILFFMIYLLINLISEIIAIDLAMHRIYNSFVFSINNTLSTPFLFGFLFAHTHTYWKRYTYLLLYLILPIYLIQGDYYNPNCILPGVWPLILNSTYFLAALVHLTDLLMNPKSDYFRVQLKVSICILICTLLAAILTSFEWADTMNKPSHSEVIFYIHFYNIVLYYFSLDLIFINEIRKIRHAL